MSKDIINKKNILILTHDESNRIDRRTLKISEHLIAKGYKIKIVALNKNVDFRSARENFEVYSTYPELHEMIGDKDSLWTRGVPTNEIKWRFSPVKYILKRAVVLAFKPLRFLSEDYYQSAKSIYKMIRSPREHTFNWKKALKKPSRLFQTLPFSTIQPQDFELLRSGDITKLRNYELPQISSQDWYPVDMTTTFLRGVEKLDLKDLAFVMACDLPALNAAKTIAERNECYLVYDAHELYPFQKEFSYRQKMFLAVTESILFNSIDFCMIASPGSAEFLKKTYKHSCEIICVNNSTFFENPNQDKVLRKRLNIPEKDIVFLYHGGFSPGRNLEEAAAAFAKLNTKDMHLVFLGEGPLHSILKNYASNQAHIYILDSVDQEELPSYVKDANFILVTYPAFDFNTQFAFPNKLGDAICLKVPFLANRMIETFAQISKKYNIGFVGEMTNLESMKNCFIDAGNWIRLNPEMNFSTAQEDLGWNGQLDKFDRSLERMFLKEPISSSQKVEGSYDFKESKPASIS